MKYLSFKLIDFDTRYSSNCLSNSFSVGKGFDCSTQVIFLYKILFWLLGFLSVDG